MCRKCVESYFVDILIDCFKLWKDWNERILQLIDQQKTIFAKHLEKHKIDINSDYDNDNQVEQVIKST